MYDRLYYSSDFEEFWKFKLRTETENAHILDDEFKIDIYRMLCRILPKWKCIGDSRDQMEGNSERFIEEYV